LTRQYSPDDGPYHDAPDHVVSDWSLASSYVVEPNVAFFDGRRRPVGPPSEAAPVVRGPPPGFERGPADARPVPVAGPLPVARDPADRLPPPLALLPLDFEPGPPGGGCAPRGGCAPGVERARVGSARQGSPAAPDVPDDGRRIPGRQVVEVRVS
jgi:hypothetical protein